MAEVVGDAAKVVHLFFELFHDLLLHFGSQRLEASFLREMMTLSLDLIREIFKKHVKTGILEELFHGTLRVLIHDFGNH